MEGLFKQLDKKLPPKRFKPVSAMSKDDFDTEIEKGYREFLSGEGRPAKKVFDALLDGVDL